MAANLSRYLSEWKKYCNNSFLLNIIGSGYKIQLKWSDIFLPPIVTIPSKLKNEIIWCEVSRLLSSGVISEVGFDDSQIVSRVFTVPKSNGGHRLVIDLSRLNKFVNRVSFRLEDKEVIKSLIQKNDYLVSIDLKDAFHTISLHQESKRLVVFQLGNKRFSYNTLPFGLSSSPRIFTKVLKPIVSHIRALGIRISSYLDDILIFEDSYTSCV